MTNLWKRIQKIKINKKMFIAYVIGFEILAGGLAVPIYSFYAKYETDDKITQSTKNLSRKLKLNYSKITQKHLLVASPVEKTTVSIKAIPESENKDKAVLKYDRTFKIPQYHAIKIPLPVGKFALKIVSQAHKSLKTKGLIKNKEDLTISKILEYQNDVVKIVKDLPKDFKFSTKDSFADPILKNEIKKYSKEEWKHFEQLNFTFLDNIDDFFIKVVNPWNKENKNNPIVVGVTSYNKDGSTQKDYKNNSKSLLIDGFPKKDTIENRDVFVKVATSVKGDNKRLSGFKSKIIEASESVIEWAINFNFKNKNLKVALVKSLDQTNSLTGVNFKNMLNTNFRVFGTIAKPKEWAKEDGYIIEKIQGKSYSWIYKKDSKHMEIIDKFKKFVEGAL